MARNNASATTKVHENFIAQILNGQTWETNPLPCPDAAFQQFTESFKTRCPSTGQTRVIGGLGKHYDFETPVSTGTKRSELKVTQGTPSPLDILSLRPWQDTVQFLQGQLKSKIGKRFLADCGEPMLRAWFDQHVKPFSTSVPASAGMTYAGYEKAMSTIGMKGKQENAAVAFIQALRSDDTLQKALHARWLIFEAEWFVSHTMDHGALKEVVKEIIEMKDFWICVSRSGISLIDGLKVLNLVFVGARPKPRGGMSFHYTLTLQRGSEMKEVPMECKFHWKNGGQAVQNLNFMLL
jgi:hypothetical protein